MSWSIARKRSTVTPLRSMIAIASPARPSVCDGAGERFSVQLTNSARRSEKSHGASAASCSWRSVRGGMRIRVSPEARSLRAQVAEGAQERLAGGRVGRRRGRFVERADEPAHVLEVAAAAVALAEVRLEPQPFGLGQRALEVVGHELDELPADQRVVVLVAPAPEPHHSLTPAIGCSVVR